MYRLEKTFRFEASHQLIHHDGKCARLHGHSWVGRVVLEGVALQVDGPKREMLLDYGDISDALEVLVEDYLDHHHLNETLGTDSPTSEFIAKWVYDRVKPLLPALTEVQIEETCTCRASYRPPQPLPGFLEVNDE